MATVCIRARASPPGAAARLRQPQDGEATLLRRGCGRPETAASDLATFGIVSQACRTGSGGAREGGRMVGRPVDSTSATPRPTAACATAGCGSSATGRKSASSRSVEPWASTSTWHDGGCGEPLGREVESGAPAVSPRSSRDSSVVLRCRVTAADSAHRDPVGDVGGASAPAGGCALSHENGHRTNAAASGVER